MAFFAGAVDWVEDDATGPPAASALPSPVAFFAVCWGLDDGEVAPVARADLPLAAFLTGAVAEPSDAAAGLADVIFLFCVRSPIFWASGFAAAFPEVLA